MSRKFIALGSILCVLILLNLPCQDVVASEPGETGNTVAIISDFHESSDSGSETCSPFCICSCCSLSVANYTTTTNVTVAAALEARRHRDVRYRNPYNINFQTNIWQPPKN